MTRLAAARSSSCRLLQSAFSLTLRLSGVTWITASGDHPVSGNSD